MAMIPDGGQVSVDDPAAHSAEPDGLVETTLRGAETADLMNDKRVKVGGDYLREIAATLTAQAAELARLRAEVERGGWQPIETAPHACHVLACRWDGYEWVIDVTLSPPKYPFTHWRPLPAPPALERRP